MLNKFYNFLKKIFNKKIKKNLNFILIKKTIFYLALGTITSLFTQKLIPLRYKLYARSIYHSLKNQSIKKYPKCDIAEIKTIPKKSTLVIGHAYGSVYLKNQFISSRFIDLVKKNENKINHIIFTGDVFYTSSDKRWNKLKSLFNPKIDIFIAPGNHDVGFKDNSKRDSFNRSGFKKDFPYYKYLSGFNIVIEDSTKNNWDIDKETINLTNSIINPKPILIFRHHIPAREFVNLANSNDGKRKKLKNLDQFNKLFKKDVTIISGDSGAFLNQPRIFCVKKEKINLIINGIGDMYQDTILVLVNGKIYKYIL